MRLGDLVRKILSSKETYGPATKVYMRDGEGELHEVEVHVYRVLEGDAVGVGISITKE